MLRHSNRYLAGLALAMVAGGAAWAASPIPKATTPASAARTTTVAILGDEIRVPLPEGQCEVAGPLTAVAEMTAAADNDNVTLLSLYECKLMAAGEIGPTYAMIKAPKIALRQNIPRPTFLEMMGAVGDTEMAKIMSDDAIVESIAKGVDDVFGMRPEIDLALKPIGKDELGYYMAGLIEMKTERGAAKVAVAVAMTSVKGHVVSYNFYEVGSDARAVASALASAKAELRRLAAANDP